MSCDRCAQAAADGQEVCGFCGEPLTRLPGEQPSARTVEPPSTASGVLAFIGAFFLALLLLVSGATLGLSGGVVGMLMGALAGPAFMIVVAQAKGARSVVAGTATALAVTALVFGGCLMAL